MAQYRDESVEGEKLDQRFYYIVRKEVMKDVYSTNNETQYH
jgi:hypothetical protein